MKIATYNVNNITKRLSVLMQWLAVRQPDIACLQELKARDEDFPLAAIEAAGYRAAWVGQPTWNGVAILARGAEPVVTRRALPGDLSDGQSRYIEAAVNGVLVASLYAPNGNPQPGPKFDYKLAWNARLVAHAAELRDAGVPVVLAGDYNIAPEPQDVYPKHPHPDNALIQPEARAAFRQLLDQGWVDAVRRIRPDGPLYTFWDYRRNRWERDAGLRLDHLLLGGDLPDRLEDAGIDRAVRGLDGASDHAPVWVQLA